MHYIIVSAVLIIFGIIWAISGITICKQLYNNVRKEDHQERGKVIQQIMKTYSAVQCVGWPIVMIAAWILYVNKNVFGIIQPFMVRYAIITLRFLFTMFRVYIGFNSLIISMCRYTFIVYENYVCKIGIQRMKYLFLCTSVALPILIAFLNEATHPIEIAWICVFQPQDNLKNPQSNNGSDSQGIFCAKDIMEDITESPIYNVLHDTLPAPFAYGIQMFTKALLITITSNILEGFMYSHTFIYIRRYFGYYTRFNHICEILYVMHIIGLK